MLSFFLVSIQAARASIFDVDIVQLSAQVPVIFEARIECVGVLASEEAKAEARRTDPDHDESEWATVAIGNRCEVTPIRTIKGEPVTPYSFFRSIDEVAHGLRYHNGVRSLVFGTHLGDGVQIRYLLHEHEGVGVVNDPKGGLVRLDHDPSTGAWVSVIPRTGRLRGEDLGNTADLERASLVLERVDAERKRDGQEWERFIQSMIQMVDE
ncbi:MAG: hypothetical protein H6737_10580 [Alphaproteobacteria bacterium]|nr:hypothetical protein [Alphaproteobacteria bacterium]